MPRTDTTAAPAPGPAPIPPAPGPPTAPEAGVEAPATQPAAPADPVQGFATLQPFAQPAPVINVNIPAAPALVDEYYSLDYSNEVISKTGSLSRVVKGKDPTGKLDKVVRYDLDEGTGLHVRATRAVVTYAADGALSGATARPVDGRPALEYGPGKAGKFGFPTPVGASPVED